MDWTQLNKWATTEVERTVASLPPPLRERARQLPVVLEAVPSGELVEDGIEPDTLGLFVGPDFAEQEQVPLPPQIILFLENIWQLVEADQEAFLDEVHVTYLHELGHYLGLDEDDLFDRELD